ncbi:MAG: helix-turn-helix domain-containing protein [Pseudonocardiaceae bacterium]
MARPRRPEFHPRLADYRRRRGLTQEQVAEVVGVTAEMVRKHEHGISMPIEIYRERYSSLYCATQVELGLQLPALERITTGTMLQLCLPISHESTSLSSITPIWTAEYVDSNYLTAAHGYIKQIIALDNRFGGADLARLAERFFRTIHSRLGEGSYSPGIKKDLLAVAGEIAEVAGWLSYDADRQDSVRRMNQESLYFTRLAGDKKMELLTLQNASMHAGFLNRSHEALHIAESVLDGGYHLSPRVRALFLTRKARALAQGGDESSLRLFREIQSLYFEGVQSTDPDWAWWIDERELAWHEAMCRQDLGDSKSAIVQFERSVEATPSTEIRSQYLHRAYLLAAQVKLRSWTAADNTMGQLRPLITEVASTRTALLIQRVLQELQADDRRVPEGLLERGAEISSILDDALDVKST